MCRQLQSQKKVPFISFILVGSSLLLFYRPTRLLSREVLLYKGDKKLRVESGFEPAMNRNRFKLVFKIISRDVFLKSWQKSQSLLPLFLGLAPSEWFYKRKAKTSFQVEAPLLSVFI